MKKLAFIMLLVPFLSASTCADQATGARPKLDAQGQPVKDEAGNIVYERAPGGGFLDLLGSLVPWGGAASGLIGSLWLAIRNKSAREGLNAAVVGVEAIKASLTPDQKAAMAKAQYRVGAKAKELVRSVAHKIEGKKES